MENVVLMLREENVGRKQWAAGSVVTEWPSEVKLKDFPLLQPQEVLGGLRESGWQ